MRISRQLAVPVLLLVAAGASAQSPARPASRVLELIPGQARTVEYYPDFRRLEAKWSKVVSLFGGTDSFLRLKHQTRIDPALVGAGPVARVTFPASDATETWVWLLPAKDAKAILKDLHATQKGAVWTWEAPAGSLRKPGKAPTPAALFGTAKAGYLVVANSEATLSTFKKPASSLSTELAPFASWLQGHDLSLVATKSAVAEAAQSASQSLQRPPAEPKAGATPEAAPSKAVTSLQAKLRRWAELAKTSVHHALGGLDLSEDGGVTFEARALLIKDSALSRELGTLAPVAGHPLRGLATQDFTLAFGGEWSLLFDFQSAILEDLDKTGKVQPATTARLQKALIAQAGLVQSMAGTFAAPAPRAAMLSGLTSLVRVADSKAYLATMEETSKAQAAFFQELGMTDASVSFTPDILAGVPSCSVTTRLGVKEDPATVSMRTAMTMLFGGEAAVMSMGALDSQRVLAVMGGPELLQARLEEARKAPEGLAPSIAAVEPDLGKDHRFALYLDPRGLRNIAQQVAGMVGGGEGRTLPDIPQVPAAGFTLSLDANAVELRGSMRAETLKATATLFKAIGSLVPARKGGARNPEL